ncbi:hypothetical protein RhiirA5_406491 [Rhizophagus irregularis]|uniref:Uncharacterized protein n=1 Tax=Rhizophagus irregularis TaxID=588596 RepID=A0A2N0QCX5_9GLOM|nr:hypothetical protein RhiirA5_406491 [Rhizophagus irregularis]
MKVVADWIGYRGTATGIMRDKHIKYAKDILQKELLLYISTEYGAIKKQAELAEPAHKLILWQVNIPENEKHVQDIDKGRIVKLHGHLFCLDQIMIMLLRNPLLILLFCILSKKLTKDVSAYLKKCIDGNHEFNLNLAIKAQTITNGLKYFLATGNWKTKKGYAITSWSLP